MANRPSPTTRSTRGGGGLRPRTHTAQTRGAVAGSLLYGMVLAFSPAYLPSDIFFYSIIFTFALLALVLAVKPNGLYGRAE